MIWQPSRPRTVCVTYRQDDHGSDVATADALQLDPTSVDSDINVFADEGIIERNTDIDYFSFTVEGLGEIINFQIDPFHNGPNLDILAKLWDSNGNLLATSDRHRRSRVPLRRAHLLAGHVLYFDRRRRPTDHFHRSVGHPDLYDVDGTIEDRPEPTPDESDWGYSDYGSLGYYSIIGHRKKSLVVGVDFDADRWRFTPRTGTSTTGGDTQVTLTGLTSEAGDSVPYTLTISTTGNAFSGNSSASIAAADLPSIFRRWMR